MTSASPRLVAALDATRRVAVRLRSSLTEDRAALDEAIAIADEEVGHALRNVLDAFVQRFQQLHEQMSRRLFPAIFRSLEAKRAPPYVELLDWVEGFELIDVIRWRALIEARNRLVHEYPLPEEDRRTALRDALGYGDMMLEDLARTVVFLERRNLVGKSDD